MRKLCLFIITIQGIYYIITGLWPVLHYESFEMMTGPKTDDWLARTIGLLSAVIGLTLLTGLGKKDFTTVGILAGGTALVFAMVDVFYALGGRISSLYLLDALFQVLFFIAVICLFNSKKIKPGYRFD